MPRTVLKPKHVPFLMDGMDSLKQRIVRIQQDEGTAGEFKVMMHLTTMQVLERCIQDIYSEREVKPSTGSLAQR